MPNHLLLGDATAAQGNVEEQGFGSSPVSSARTLYFIIVVLTSMEIQRTIAGNKLLTCSDFPLIMAYTKGNGCMCAENRGVNPFIVFVRECAWGMVSLSLDAATCLGKTVRK